MSRVKDAIGRWWGLPFAIVGGIVGYLNLPPGFSNTWRVVIFVALLGCYVLGFKNGSKKTSDDMERQLAGKDAALEREKEKSAKLVARWDKFNSEESRKRKTFDVLNEREKWLLAVMIDMSPKTFSTISTKYLPLLEYMCDAKIVKYTGEVIVDGGKTRSYTIAIDWRIWLTDHLDELPDPHSAMPE